MQLPICRGGEECWHSCVCPLTDKELVKKLLSIPMKAITAEMLKCRTYHIVNSGMDLMGLGNKNVHAIYKGPCGQNQNMGLNAIPQ